MKNKLPKNVKYWVANDGGSTDTVWTSESCGAGHSYYKRGQNPGIWYGYSAPIGISWWKEVTYQEASKVLGLEDEVPLNRTSFSVKVNPFLSKAIQEYWFSEGFEWRNGARIILNSQYDYLVLNGDGNFAITYATRQENLNLGDSIYYAGADWDLIVTQTNYIKSIKNVPKYNSVWEFVYISDNSKTTKWRKMVFKSECKYYIRGYDLDDKNIEKTFTKSKIVGGMDKVTKRPLEN